VLDRLVEIASHGIFGYTDVKDDYYRALSGWFERRFDFPIRRSWVKKLPGVVFGLAQAIKAFTDPGDPVLIQSPVYYPFSGCARENERRVVDSPLIYRDGAYQIDFDDFERKIKSEHIKLFLLCSPHNPVGRVWSFEELKELAHLCLKYRCVVVSDEIHCDFVFGGRKHYIFTQVEPALEELTVILTAPSKTFNLAGLQNANAIIPNPLLKSRFSVEISRTGLSQLNVMGLAAAQAAYEKGDEWLAQLLIYLEGNLKLAKEFFESELKPLGLIETEGTYLLWIDFKPLGLDDKAINELVIKKAKLWLDAGTMFGQSGSGFQRLNMACPRLALSKALESLAKAIRS
jgi:cystathionine beta-lyase